MAEYDKKGYFVTKILLLFPGQGSQYIGMGKRFCEESENAKLIFEQANDILKFDLKKLCFEGDIKELTKTNNTQPAILTTSIACYKLYMEQLGVLPAFAAGHSLGEYSALVCSGVISFPDALKMVRKRGELMQEASTLGQGSMAAVGKLDEAVIKETCESISTDNQIVVISNYNSPDQTVISGHSEAVKAACEILEKRGGLVTPLRVSAPFHSPLMEPVLREMKKELAHYKYNYFQFPVISNVNALPYSGPDTVIGNLSAQIIAPVKWVDSMQYIKNEGITLAIEIGPKTVLKNLMKKNVPAIKAYSYDDKKDVEILAKELRKGSKSMENISLIVRCMANAVCTLNRNWDNDEYRKGVIEPYKAIQHMQEEIETDGNKPTIEQMTKALEMLRSVFITKKVPVKEQIERFNQVFEETGTTGRFPDFKMPE